MSNFTLKKQVHIIYIAFLFYNHKLYLEKLDLEV